MTTSPRTTSWDVARLAGVSRSTVSQVLNGNDERFPQETRDRVKKAATELAYRPSRAGRSLVSGVSDLIVVVVPNVTFGRHLQDAVDVIANSSASRGMSVVVRYAGNDIATTVSAVLDLRPAVVIDLGVFDEAARLQIERSGILTIPEQRMVARMIENPNHLIGRLQVRHLLETPGRRIVSALLVDARLDTFGPERLQGVMDEAAALGVDPPIVIRVPLTLAGAVEALSAVVEAHPNAPLGVCCYNDDVAIATMAAARVLGLRVPEDVAVVGVDNTEVGQLITPRLTTISVDLVGNLEAFLVDGGLAQQVPGGATISDVLADPSTFVKLEVGDST